MYRKLIKTPPCKCISRRRLIIARAFASPRIFERPTDRVTMCPIAIYCFMFMNEVVRTEVKKQAAFTIKVDCGLTYPLSGLQGTLIR